MASRTTVARAQVAAAMLLLSAAAAAATALWPSSRALFMCGIAAVVAAAMAGRGLARLAASEPRPEPPFASDGAELARRFALLDSQLEQLPVALWRGAGGRIEPMNARARRLIAPGGALDRDELLDELARAAAGARGKNGLSGRKLLHVATERGSERWLLSATALELAGAETRLLAMLPVESELEAETLRAWRQLVHVLTHEIMNSLTPIASLSRTAQEMLAEPPGEEREQDLTLALEAVARRAESLARFVSDYRQVSELPAPRPEPVLLAELFARLEALVGADWRARGGAARFEVEPASLTLQADAGQLEQALLNLIRNAAQATAELAAPSLVVRARLTRGGRLAIEVRDNGPGVPAGLERDIFLPFFSARAKASDGPASGIGLAVVRNLVHGMGGTVRSVRMVGGGACFVLSF